MLVREGSTERLDALIEGWGRARSHRARDRGPRRAAPRRLGRAGRRAQGQGRPLLPPGGDLRHDRGRRVATDGSTSRAPATRSSSPTSSTPAPSTTSPRSPPPACTRASSARTCSTRARSSTTPTTARSSSPRSSPARRPRALARLPPGDRRRQLQDRRDGQDRRALLLLQGDPDGPHYLPEWVPLVGPELGYTNVVPVDYVAGAMDHIAHQPGLDGRPSTSPAQRRSARAT